MLLGNSKLLRTSKLHHLFKVTAISFNGWILPIGVALGRVCAQPAKQACLNRPGVAGAVVDIESIGPEASNLNCFYKSFSNDDILYLQQPRLHRVCLN